MNRTHIPFNLLIFLSLRKKIFFFKETTKSSKLIRKTLQFFFLDLTQFDHYANHEYRR